MHEWSPCRWVSEQQRPRPLQRAPAMDAAVEVLFETARFLRRDGPAYAAILLLLLCPASVALLSDALVGRSLARMLSRRAALLATSSGIPPTRFVHRACAHLVATLLSAISGFPLLFTVLLPARAAVAYAVACRYAGRKILASEFLKLLRKVWRNLVLTYLFSCMATLGCLALFLSVLITACNVFVLMGSPPELILCPVLLVILAFVIAHAHVVIVCNLASIISVLEDRPGAEALLRSLHLVRRQTQSGFLIFLGTTIGMTLVEGFLEYKARSLGKGEMARTVWEGPLLVLLYSAVVMVDYATNAVFYFTCRSSGVDEIDGT